jgi:hypothetical protein
MGKNPNPVVLFKSAMDMDIVTWCKWRKNVLIFFYATFMPQNKTKLNAQHSTLLGTCLFGDKFVVV